MLEEFKSTKFSCINLKPFGAKKKSERGLKRRRQNNRIRSCLSHIKVPSRIWIQFKFHSIFNIYFFSVCTTAKRTHSHTFWGFLTFLAQTKHNLKFKECFWKRRENLFLLFSLLLPHFKHNFNFQFTQYFSFYSRLLREADYRPILLLQHFVDFRKSIFHFSLWFDLWRREKKREKQIIMLSEKRFIRLKNRVIGIKKKSS